MISREQAFEVASGAIKNGNIVGVYSTEGNVFNSPALQYILNTLHNSDGSREECWVAYIDDGHRFSGLRSSQIVVVKQSDGAIVYMGSAVDEG